MVDHPKAVVIRSWSCLLLVAGAAACADPNEPRTGVTDITAVATGTLVVRVVSNVDFDPNGFRLGVDAAAPTFIPAVFPGYEQAVTISGLSAGAHSLNISGVPENCTARPQSPVAFAVSEGTTAHVEVSVTCLTHE
ncbi:MAG: hypothetical protein DMD54_02670 [Gemmatimonadetes bacterium]|nr:MAG: hypothetical protein DMD54_02670 [Gemmatimonadota bacterium]